MQTVSTLPKGFQGTNACAEIRSHPSGRFLYVANRNAGAVSIFTISGKSVTPAGKVDFGGILKEASLAYVPEAKVGDYVIVHVGFAIGRPHFAVTAPSVRAPPA